MLRWTTDLRAGDWLVERLTTFAVDVGSIAPRGFEACARVLHPIEDGPFRRWRELAAHHGREMHPEVQPLRINRPRGESTENAWPTSIDTGSLPRAELEVLVRLLHPHTTDPTQCWFAVWHGWGQLHAGEVSTALVPGAVPARVLDGPRLKLPQREYLLLEGALDDVLELHGILGGTGGPLSGQSPSLWWPAERSWCVATEVDFGWTYVVGSQPLIDDLLACAELEVLPATMEDGVTVASDERNAALDHAPPMDPS